MSVLASRMIYYPIIVSHRIAKKKILHANINILFIYKLQSSENKYQWITLSTGKFRSLVRRRDYVICLDIVETSYSYTRKNMQIWYTYFFGEYGWTLIKNENSFLWLLSLPLHQRKLNYQLRCPTFNNTPQITNPYLGTSII